MFTGIVTSIGRVRRVTLTDGGVDLVVAAPYSALRLGESIAVNGACLTVAGRGQGWFRVHAVATTLTRTLCGTFERGRRVNLERALRPTDRLGGHFVQGHVDGIGEVIGTAEYKDALLIDLDVPRSAVRTTAPRGSIAVDGVSMTVNAKPNDATIQISVIPYTRSHTTLGNLTAGDRVHIEVDLLAKYVEQLMSWRSTP